LSIVDEPRNTYWPTWQSAVDCAGKKFIKNETFTAYDFSKRCNIDFRTANKYLPRMVIDGVNLGGGKRILPAAVVREGYVLDPPGENSSEAARDKLCRDLGCNQTNKTCECDKTTGAIIAIIGIGALVLSLLCFASNRRELRIPKLRNQNPHAATEIPIPEKLLLRNVREV
jgi:hypothetical protein